MSSAITLRRVPHVLGVDDHEDSLYLLSQILEPMDCTYELVTTSKAALAAIERRSPDLLLIDIVLPHMSGIQLIERLRKSRQTSCIPAIAVTGLAMPHERQLILRSGFNDYLCKPYLLQDLEIILRRYLRCPAPALAS